MSGPGERGAAMARLIPINRQQPPLDARQATAAILVIARIVYTDREEWWPARADSWNDSIVHVTWHDQHGHWCQEWVPAEDVRRGIVVGTQGAVTSGK